MQTLMWHAGGFCQTNTVGPSGCQKKGNVSPNSVCTACLDGSSWTFFLFWKLFNCAPLFVFAANTVRLPACETVPRITGTFSIWFGDRLLTWSVAVWGPYARSKPAISKPHTCNLVLVACCNATNTFSVWLRTIFPRHLCSWCIPDVRRWKIDSCRRVKLSQLRAGLVLQAGC